ncbi:MAG: hypothetical protein NTY53_21990 [Kiritimatiellaeota bacterium]|nr:hypothetical protein [Kiritimatiellota bacterium]
MTVGINASWEGREDLMDLLRQVQQIARREGSAVFQFGSYRAVMTRHSPKLGDSSNPYRMTFRITVNGLTILLQDRRRASGRSPNVIVQATGLFCLSYSIQEILSLIRAIITSASGRIVSEKLSRIDIALDLPNVPMDEFLQAYRERRYISRAGAPRVFESTGVSLYFGKKPLELIIYDKYADMRRKHGLQANSERHLLITRCWGGEVTAATRIEFRLCRKALTSRGIDTPADFLEKAPELIQYLTHSWFRMTAAAVDRTNTSRAATLPLWTEVAAGFQAWAGNPNGASLAPLPRRGNGISALAGQIRSRLFTLVAQAHLRPMSRDEFLRSAFSLIARSLRGVDVEAEIAKRLAEIPGTSVLAAARPPTSSSIPTVHIP